MDLQNGEHDSVEDARAALKLYLHVKSEWESRKFFRENVEIKPAEPLAQKANSSSRSSRSSSRSTKRGARDDADDTEDMATLYSNLETTDSLCADVSEHLHQGVRKTEAATNGGDKAKSVLDGKAFGNKHQRWRFIQKQRKRGLL